jgi:hypothetical protein
MRLIAVDLPGDGIAGPDAKIGREVGIDRHRILTGPGQDRNFSGFLGRRFRRWSGGYFYHPGYFYFFDHFHFPGHFNGQGGGLLAGS